MNKPKFTAVFHENFNMLKQGINIRPYFIYFTVIQRNSR